MSARNRYLLRESPLGPLLLTSYRGDHVTGLSLEGMEALGRIRSGAKGPEWGEGARILSAAALQLREYFAGERESFDLPLLAEGTPFQDTVWTALREIPYGQTLTYGGLARSIGRPGAMRAVGGACGRNPLPIFLPCHRVVGSDGRLTGFGGGIPRKAFLLEMEARGRRPTPPRE